MKKIRNIRQIILINFLFYALMGLTYAQPSDLDAALNVWANEAIVSAYTLNDTQFLEKQKQTARYFTATAWINYSKAFQASKLQEAIIKNHYTVNAVALAPPTIQTLGNQQWQATMPILVVYQNPSYEQKQTLTVTINFMRVPQNQGVRGLAITLFQSKETTPPCSCAHNGPT